MREETGRPQPPEKARGFLLTMRAEYFRSAAAAGDAVGFLPELFESKFLWRAPWLAPEEDWQHSRSRSAARKSPPPAEPAELDGCRRQHSRAAAENLLQSCRSNLDIPSPDAGRWYRAPRKPVAKSLPA